LYPAEVAVVLHAEEAAHQGEEAVGVALVIEVSLS
jgi:hypothetical protein